MNKIHFSTLLHILKWNILSYETRKLVKIKHSKGDPSKVSLRVHFQNPTPNKMTQIIAHRFLKHQHFPKLSMSQVHVS